VVFLSAPPQKLSTPTLAKYDKALLVVDNNLGDPLVNTVERLIRQEIQSTSIFIQKYGAKNLARVQVIWDKMMAVSPDVVIAVGGGVTCDLVGFAASCLYRGTDHLFFPTTVLSMIDTCIGVKADVDYRKVKNSIGSTHYAPSSTNIVSFLETLAREEYRSGFSEAIKWAMLADALFFERLDAFSRCSEEEQQGQLTEVLATAASLKAMMIGKLKAAAYSQLVLYGHNIGHAW
jgi:3-dehydroquinate synthase